MRWMTLALLAVLAASMVIAQPTGEVKGRVVDRESQKLLSGAHITLPGTPHGTTSDAQGEFRLEGIPPGTYEIRFAYVGYGTITMSVTVAADRTAWLSVALSPRLIQGQPITITATRGRERETPVTFSMLERGDVRDRHTTQDIPALLSELPSATYYSESGNNIGYTYLNIRGFDSRRIAVMINGIPQNDPEDHNIYWLDMPDLAASLEDIQVQRGAGSAFYGAPAIGGSVNLVTASLGRERSVRAFAGYGSYQTRKYMAAVSSGLLDGQFALSGRISRLLSSGYREKSWIDFTGYFIGGAWYGDDMTAQINVYGGPVSDGLAYFGVPKSYLNDRSLRRYNPIRRPEEKEEFSQPHVELFHEWRLSPSLSLNTSLFYIYGNGFFDYDGAWAPLTYYRMTPQNGFPVTGDPDTLYIGDALIRAQVTNRQWGWLPRVTWKHNRGELIAGGEIRVHRSLHWGGLQQSARSPIAVPPGYRYYDYRGAKTIASLYAHHLYDLRPGWTLMTDLHYVYNRYRLYEEKYLKTDFSVPYHFLNPRLGLNLNFDEHWNVYVSGGYTSREPRLKNLYDAAEASTPPSWGQVVPQFAVDQSGTMDFSRPLVKPESLFNLELGTAYAMAGSRATANVYWMEFTDEIVKSGQVDRFGQPITGNAERTRHLGIELTGRLELGAGFDLGLNTTVSRNRFVRHTDYSSGSGLTLDGNPIAGFPEFLANARLTYRTGPLVASVAGRYLGKQYTDNFNDEANTVDPSFVTEASLSCRIGEAPGLEARVQVNNVFDVLYAAYGEGDQFFVAAERNVFFNISVTL